MVYRVDPVRDLSLLDNSVGKARSIIDDVHSNDDGSNNSNCDSNINDDGSCNSIDNKKRKHDSTTSGTDGDGDVDVDNDRSVRDTNIRETNINVVSEEDTNSQLIKKIKVQVLLNIIDKFKMSQCMIFCRTNQVS